ncbi:asparagine synthase-related protein [Teredinibacter sp. KSP-S5-2]|uniref:asparagine synthase-related protein n=1 Tax=Teredinibacter sp. KSP-S5-2 TaxID=3034506 RepID=UPI00293428D0|nr:asparagine synthase-related protein [Teredinibacter sp. KSP-S5-2]WNO09097.1 asparagine synthase-related protein [Teredinibacter sp. KSP-S5-2]
MSAIYAVFSNKQRVELTVKQMRQASDYWQPDNTSYWFSETNDAGLGKGLLLNTRDSTHDGAYYWREKKLAITANARLDNRAVLMEMLSLDKKSHVFTDSQIILHAYYAWGNECVQHLKGDFVFIILNELEDSVFCARDHFGVKTLFYSENPDGLMLTNEHRAFYTSEWCENIPPDQEEVLSHIWSMSPQHFESPNKHIKQLPPAHILEYSKKNGLIVRRYWRLTPKNDWQDLSDEALLNKFKELFSQAVSRRLDSQFPIGTELSEGLDSNAVTGYAAKLLKSQPLYTFSFDCIHPVSDQQGEWSRTYRDILDMIDMHNNLIPIWQQEQAFNRYAYINKGNNTLFRHLGGVFPFVGGRFIRSHLAGQQGIRVLLSGWGGDHCVTSYGDQYAYDLLRNMKLFQLLQLLTTQYERGRYSNPTLALVRVLIKGLIPKRILASCSTLTALLQKDVRVENHFLHSKWSYIYAQRAQRKRSDSFKTTVQDKEQYEIYELGLTNILTQSELYGRMSRLEYRFPMLDIDLVEFCHSLPARIKIHNAIERYPIRYILNNYTTEKIRWRIKSDAIYPKTYRERNLFRYKHELSDRLQQSELAKSLCNISKIQKCLDSLNPFYVRALDYLINTEKFYFSSVRKQLD